MMVEECGLTLLEAKSFVGASSDDFVTCLNGDTNTKGCLEVKCPFSIEGKTVAHLTPDKIATEFGRKFYLVHNEDGELRLRQDHIYYAQVQGEMNILNVEWCDFVVFSGGVVHVDRIICDWHYWVSEMLPALEDFYVKHVIPEIVGGQIFMDEYHKVSC